MRMWQKALSISLSAMFLTGMIASAAQTDPGTGSTDIWAMNVDPTNAASVVVDYIGQDGVPAKTITVSVNPYGAATFLASAASGLPDGWSGSAILSSDRELAAVATSSFTGGTAPTTVASYPGFAAGAQAIYFPTVQQRDTVFTRVSVQNTGSGTANVQLFFYNRDGTAYSGNPINDTIPEGAQKTYDMSKPGTNGVPTMTPRNLPDGWNGGLIVRSTNEIAGVAMTFLPSYGTAYPAVTAAARTLYYPTITRRNIPAAGGWVQWCGNVVQNVSGSTANITTYWTDRSGNVLYHFTDQIAPFSAHGYNTRDPNNSNVPPADRAPWVAALGDDRNGALYITSDQDMVGVSDCQINLPQQGSVGQYTYVAQGTGNNNLFAAQVYRTVVNGNGTRRTGIIVENPDQTNAANVRISFRRQDGTEPIPSVMDQIPAKSSHGYNTGVGSNYPGSNTSGIAALGNDFTGQVVITSDRPVIGVAVQVVPNEGDSYNMYGK